MQKPVTVQVNHSQAGRIRVMKECTIMWEYWAAENPGIKIKNVETKEELW